MTRQISDYLEAEERSYIVCAFKGENKFVPQSIGLQRGGLSTACYKGWHAKWKIQDGRLFVNELTIYVSRLPSICGISPKRGRCTSVYESLMLPCGFTGDLTVIPEEDDERARELYYCVPENDEIVPLFTLEFDFGRLKGIRNRSYFLEANAEEDEPGQLARKGRIFGHVPTPFDQLKYQHFLARELNSPPGNAEGLDS